jgi:hypothetical protein
MTTPTNAAPPPPADDLAADPARWLADRGAFPAVPGSVDRRERAEQLSATVNAAFGAEVVRVGVSPTARRIG